MNNSSNVHHALVSTLSINTEVRTWPRTLRVSGYNSIISIPFRPFRISSFANMQLFAFVIALVVACVLAKEKTVVSEKDNAIRQTAS